MLDTAGTSSSADRREVDLYITTDNVGDLFLRLKDQVEVVEDLHDTFYGMRELLFATSTDSGSHLDNSCRSNGDLDRRHRCETHPLPQMGTDIAGTYPLP